MDAAHGFAFGYQFMDFSLAEAHWCPFSLQLEIAR
ncbi:unnamed protein product [Gongylonema pulchrum]|uniref:FERM domain-containing protein n=1 Tax=Gongylonema pulchrum TaxID=637853 RepID=A0A183E351_9BILA|nr:unnamed protein product [Gongylonema pulchrum]